MGFRLSLEKEASAVTSRSGSRQVYFSGNKATGIRNLTGTGYLGGKGEK